MKHKSKICFKDLDLIILDKKQKKFDVEKFFFEKIIWMLLKVSKQTDTLAEPAVESHKFMNFIMKSFC